MDKYPEYTSNIGSHKGWIEYHWRQYDRPWRLLAIEDAEPRSMITSQDEDRHHLIWPRHSIRSFPGIMTPQAAIEIISIVYIAFDAGVDNGRKIKMQEIKRALEL